MWKDLTMREKAALMRVAIKNGIYGLEEIRNRYDEGGHINNYVNPELIKYNLGFTAQSTEDSPIVYRSVGEQFNKPYKELSNSLRNAINKRFDELNIPENYETAYNSNKYKAALEAKFLHYPKSGRVRRNDSPTRFESSALEDTMNKVVYNARERVSPNMRYAIPYIEDKEIKIPGVGRVSTNALDSIAKYAELANLPLSEAIGLASQETSLGAITNDNYIEGDYDFNRALGNSSYFRNYGIIPAENLVRDFRYNIKEDPIDRSVPPLLHAFKYYKSGKYNTGDPNHTKDVRRKGREVTNTEVVKEWARNKGYKL